MKSDPEKQLWSTIHEPHPSTSDIHVGLCKVICPDCSKEVFQCRHCESNIWRGSSAVSKRNRDPANYLVWSHIQLKHKALHAGSNDDTGFGDSGSNDVVDFDESERSQRSGVIEENNEYFDQDPDPDDNEYFDQDPDPDGDFNPFAYSEAEESSAFNYTDGLIQTDLDPNTAITTPAILQSGNYGTGQKELNEKIDEGYYYNDFEFLDFRTEEEKKKKLFGGSEPLCQNQLYFYQRYKFKRCYQHNEQQAKCGKECKDFGGFMGLCGRASDLNNENASATTNPRQARVLFLLLRILLKVPKELRGDVLEYQNGLLSLFKVGEGRKATDIGITLPTDVNIMRQTLLEGSYSVLKNFPVPRVYEIGNHACVDLKEVILLAAGHGAKFNFAWNARKGARNNEGLNGTQAVTDLITDCIEAMGDAKVDAETTRNTNVGWIYFWSDSFLRCFIKQKENSVWILTVTICPPEKEKSNGMYTYVLAMGKSSEDHTPVIEHYFTECQKLMKGFDCYFGDTNKIERMAVGMLMWNADRPERQMINNTRKEGTYGKVSGWSAPVSEEKFPSCDKCYKRLVQEMIQGEEGSGTGTVDSCTNCFNWTLDQDDTDQITEDTHKDYPKEQSDDNIDINNLSKSDSDLLNKRKPGKDNKIGPAKLTPGFLKAVAGRVYRKRLQKRWSKDNAEQYCRACNIAGYRFEKIEEAVELDQAKQTTDDPKDYVRPEDGAKYEPKIWSLIDCFDRFRMPELPMHGLAHGIIPDVIEIIHSILSHYGKLTAFCNFGNEYLADIESFKLDYCKVKSLPKSAWVSENSLGYARLMPYLYGTFLSRYPLVAKGNETPRTKETVANLKCLLNALQALMSVLMSKDAPSLPTHPDEEEKRKHEEEKRKQERNIDNHMKLLMSSANYLHKRYGSLAKREAEENVLLAQLTSRELDTILESFGLSLENDGAKERKAALDKITLKQLKNWCKKRNIKHSHLKKKKDLQKVVFEKIIGRVLREPGEESEVGGRQGGESEVGAQQGEENVADRVGNELKDELPAIGNNVNDEEAPRPQSEKRCWNKGNWLSFTANIARQIRYLGPLCLIW